MEDRKANHLEEKLRRQVHKYVRDDRERPFLESMDGDLSPPSV